MIIDRIEEQSRYLQLHPDMENAFAFLAEAPDLDVGLYELDNGAYARIVEGDTVPMDSLPLEAHRKYIDVQYCLSGGERMSWAHIQELNQVSENPAADIYVYEGNSTSVSIRPGMFYIMFPSDAHKTHMHREFVKHYRKAVVKLPVQPEE